MERVLNYIDFVDIYSAFNEEEMQTFQRRYPEEYRIMAGLTERFRNEGIQQGRQYEAQHILRKLVGLKFSELPEWAEESLKAASLEELETWIENILTANSLDALISK